MQGNTLKDLLPETDPILSSIEIKEVLINKKSRQMKVSLCCERLPEKSHAYIKASLLKAYVLSDIDISYKPPKSIAQKKAEEEKKIIARLAAEYKNGAKSEIILGKKIKGKYTPLSHISADSSKVKVKGVIFYTEFKERRDGSYIISIYINDDTSSIILKLFCESAKIKGLKSRLKNQVYIAAQGDVVFDKFIDDVVIMASSINELPSPQKRMDTANKKRIELHLHTKMSAMDGVSSIEDVIKRASEWGHRAIALTDHGVVQAFPNAYEGAKETGIKLLYGVEAYMVDDSVPIVFNPTGYINGEFVVFDIETTGLSNQRCHIIELGASKIKDGRIIDTFSSFVCPPCPIPAKITELTGITDAMVNDAKKIEDVLPEFLKFCEGCVLVAHNASFDTGFIRAAAKRQNLNFNFCYIDTVALSRKLYPQLTNHRLNTLAKHLSVKLDNHHRALDDALATAIIFIIMQKALIEMGIDMLSEINSKFGDTVDVRGLSAYHTIILAKNYTGLRNLYELISKSHLDYFYYTPRVPKSLLSKMREGLIIGSACEAGEVFKAVLNDTEHHKLKEIISFYDYLEIQPALNNAFLIREGLVENEEELKKINKNIVELGKKYGKKTVATCDVHFLDPQDEVYRRVLMAGKGFDDADNQPPLYFRTTQEMLEEFSYLGKQTAYEVVVTNTNLICDMIDEIKPIPDETFPPIIEGAKEDIIKISNNKAIEIYGDLLPDIVKKRMQKELHSITTYGFSVMYIIAQKLVSKSLSDGYLVGSRGSVGSSFIAFLLGITEVNALPAHYICKSCKYSEFLADGAGISGFDMDDKNCPVCGKPLYKDGHDIPFETFLGFEGDKEPDIDLNFSGDYQSIAHKYTEELFGEGHVFRAGTVGTVADKTAFGYVKKYFDERSLLVNTAEIKRIVEGCTGVKRTTGQHPGGVMIVPHNKNIHEFCPIQHPADDAGSGVITTHFDYHAISGKLLKLDILGHDDPTVIKMLEDLTGVDAKTIPLDDNKTMSIFLNTNALGVTPNDIDSKVGTYGVPEFGTAFVRQMLIDTKPTTFSELVRISGLSHGTDVWLNNAQDNIRNGVCTLSEAICTRDDIMLYLIHKKLEPKLAFTIMEKVRKGKGLSAEDETEMRSNYVPEWYIDSCKKIKYMFPKAHAVAYVTMAFRIAYFKVHYPIEYYATYFTVRASGDFDAEIMCHGIEKAREALKELKSKDKLTAKEENVITVLEICIEMYARGLKFVPIDLYKSDAIKFICTDQGILPPLCSLQGVSEAAAQSIVYERNKDKFFSIDDLHNRTKISKTALEILKRNGCFKGIPQSSQVSLFDLV